MRFAWTLCALMACGRLASEPSPPAQADASADASLPPPACTMTTPQTLATASAIGSFALHGSSVVWNSLDGLWSTPKEGGPAVKLSSCRRSFAIDGDDAFCLDWQADQLWRVPLDGSPSVALDYPPGLSEVASVGGFASGHAYTFGGAKICAVDELTGEVQTLVWWAMEVQLFAVTDGRFYWSSTKNLYTDSPVTTLNEGEATVLATLNGYVTHGAINASEMFFSADHLVYRMPLAGGTPLPFVSNLTGDVFVVDDSTLYAVTSDGVRAFPLAGGPSASTNVPKGPIERIAIDESYIYWTAMNQDDADQYSTSLYRVCR